MARSVHCISGISVGLLLPFLRWILDAREQKNCVAFFFEAVSNVDGSLRVDKYVSGGLGMNEGE